nr:unnamed protein product [Callosobruchus chinensis]
MSGRGLGEEYMNCSTLFWRNGTLFFKKTFVIRFKVCQEECKQPFGHAEATPVIRNAPAQFLLAMRFIFQ